MSGDQQWTSLQYEQCRTALSQWVVLVREPSSDVQIDSEEIVANPVETGTDMFNSSHRGDNSDPEAYSARMDDPFENMREQMDRQRDEFFNLNPRDWPSDNSNLRSGFFNKVGCQQISPVPNIENMVI